MRALRTVLVCLASASTVQANTKSAQSATPVEKVIELLKNLVSKTEAEGKQDAADYDKFACFCKEQADEKLYAIEKSQKKLNNLAAKINQLTGEIAEENTAISDLSATISDHEAEIKRLQDLNDVAHEGYVEQEEELASCISALRRAMKAMEESKEGQVGDSDVDLLQKGSRLLNPASKLKVTVALQKINKPGEAHSYTYQSNDIIATLQDLLITFKENKKELDETEFARKAAFEKKKLAIENEKKFSEKDKSEREAIVEAKNEELKEAEKGEFDEKEMKNADQAFLDALTEECQTKANEWDARSSMRADELKTLNEAIQTLKSGAQENYGANKKLAGIQKSSVVTKGGHWVWVEPPQGKPASFLQIYNSHQAPQRAIQQLTQAAKRLQSDVLSAAVMKISVSADHFVKVRATIKDLIARLEANAEEEATQKSFCDQAMGEATASRDEANGIIEEKTAAINVAEAEEAQLKEEIQALEKGISQNMKALNEATELRTSEKAENEKTIEEAEAGHEAVSFAITILKEFYEGSGFVQTKASYVPPNADRDGNTVADMAPKVMQASEERKGASKGILGLLDVILSDFERTLEQVRTDEDTAQGAFDQLEADTKSDNEAKKSEIESKQQRLSELADEIIDLTEDKKNGQQQQEDAKKKFKELKPMCVEGEETYEARVAKREKEIEALKEALTLLDTMGS